jgi:hypothetical protein
MAQLCGLKAPGHVYSATLTNSSDNDVTVEVQYAGSDESQNETVSVTVPQGGSQTLEEKSVKTDAHEQRKFIQKLTVTSENGAAQELTAPFEGVTSPKQNWQFEVGQNGSLKSVSQ